MPVRGDGSADLAGVGLECLGDQQEVNLIMAGKGVSIHRMDGEAGVGVG